MNPRHHGRPPVGFMFACPMCPDKLFVRRDTLRRHFNTLHAKRWFQCDMCSVEVHTRSGLNRHIRNVHNVSPDPYGKRSPVNYPEELFTLFVRVPREDAEEDEAVETPISPIVEFPASPSPSGHDSKTSSHQVAEEVENPVDSVELPTSPLIQPHGVEAEEVHDPEESTVELPPST